MSLAYLMYFLIVIVPLFLLLYFTLRWLPEKKAFFVALAQIAVIILVHYLVDKSIIHGVSILVSIIVFPVLNIYLKQKAKKK